MQGSKVASVLAFPCCLLGSQLKRFLRRRYMLPLPSEGRYQRRTPCLVYFFLRILPRKLRLRLGLLVLGRVPFLLEHKGNTAIALRRSRLLGILLLVDVGLFLGEFCLCMCLVQTHRHSQQDIWAIRFQVGIPI